LHFSTPDTSFTPANPLDVEMTPPVGRRYYWHVRACGTKGCDDWSPISYVDVGRQIQDFNGDGYADVVVAVPTAAPVTAGGPSLGGALVYFGGPDLPASPGWTLPADPGNSIWWVRWIGDVDGDGFGDLAVIEGGHGYIDRVRVYKGGNSPVADAAIELTQPSWSVSAVMGGMDLNGDGFVDVVVSYRLSGMANVGVLPGGASLAQSMLTPPVAFALVDACDWNADDLGDLILQSPDGIDVLSGSASAPLGGQMQSVAVGSGYEAIGCVRNFSGRGGASLLLLYAGNPGDAAALTMISGPAVLPSNGCDAPLPQVGGGVGPYAASSYPAVAHPGDVDRDGFDDAVLGDAPNNRAILFFGGCPPQRALVLPGAMSGSFTPVAGYAVGAIGDINGDGFPDLAVGNPYEGTDGFGVGEVYLYLGGSNPRATPDALLRSPVNTPTPGTVDGFGASVD